MFKWIEEINNMYVYTKCKIFHSLLKLLQMLYQFEILTKFWSKFIVVASYSCWFLFVCLLLYREQVDKQDTLLNRKQQQEIPCNM